MQYVMSKYFQTALQALYAKGGPFRTAADKVHAMWSKAREGYSEKDVFSVATTHNGESRIQHCVKYDLPGRARLLVVKHQNVCIFLYTGDHNNVDEWIDTHKGMDWVSAIEEGDRILQPVYTSDLTVGPKGSIKAGQDLGAAAELIEMLPQKYQDRLLVGLNEEILNRIRHVGPLTDEDVIYHIGVDVLDVAGTNDHGEAVFDTLMLLRAGDVRGAKARIDLFYGKSIPVDQLSTEEAKRIVSGQDAIVINEVDPVLFEHFVKTASFRDWMLYLHPAQRQHAGRDFNGPARLAGVSGSGKTCVLIHRAIRLAKKYPDERIGILTLNPALARLVKDLVASAAAGEVKNLSVYSMSELCRELLAKLEPGSERIYTHITETPNPFAESEHIEEIWEEFYQCGANNSDYDLMLPAHRSLLARGIYPRDYLRQELDYIRSALAPVERKEYREMERKGRVIPLDVKLRDSILDGLEMWEKKMRAVGAIDDMGMATALYAHLEKLSPIFRCLLVDEVQDFGSLELKIIRRLVADGENDLFLCGDTAQTVSTKHHDLQLAGISAQGRFLKLHQNYRNSRQILTVAHKVLTANFEKRSKGFVDLEILDPEHANFSSSLPTLLSCGSLKEELKFALGYLKWVQNEQRADYKMCIAICGYSQHGLQSLGKQLGMPVLSGDTDVIGGKVFLSDLEQTKGFEFDAMVILNCTRDVLPHPELPPEESFRELCKLYVAMTRAKHELIVSFSGDVSEFVTPVRDAFSEGRWEDYAEAEPLSTLQVPQGVLAPKNDPHIWSVPAMRFIKYRDAVGLDAVLQDELLEHVQGKERYVQGHQMGWSTVSDFLRAMPNPRSRRGVLSNEAWERLNTKLSLVRSEPNNLA